MTRHTYILQRDIPRIGKAGRTVELTNAQALYFRLDGSIKPADTAAAKPAAKRKREAAGA
jgi:hypothetical protein